MDPQVRHLDKRQVPGQDTPSNGSFRGGTQRHQLMRSLFLSRICTLPQIPKRGLFSCLLFVIVLSNCGHREPAGVDHGVFQRLGSHLPNLARTPPRDRVEKMEMLLRPYSPDRDLFLEAERRAELTADELADELLARPMNVDEEQLVYDPPPALINRLHLSAHARSEGEFPYEVVSDSIGVLIDVWDEVMHAHNCVLSSESFAAGHIEGVAALLQHWGVSEAEAKRVLQAESDYLDALAADLEVILNRYKQVELARSSSRR